MKEIIKFSDWDDNQHKKLITIEDNKIIIDNSSQESITIESLKNIKVDKTVYNCYIKFDGTLTNSGGYLNINNLYKIPINGESKIPIKDIDKLNFSVIVSANSRLEYSDIIIEFNSDIDLIETIDTKKKVLVIAPEYPSYVNLYYCAFAHSRNKEYVKNGIDIQVFVVNSYIQYQTKYEKDDVPVIKGTYGNLKKLLSNHNYSVIITHFVDEFLFPIFDGYIYQNQRLIFICHGPETVYRYLVNKTRPYFTKPFKEPVDNPQFDIKDYYVRKYSKKDNVLWIFVSDWLKKFSEEQQNLEFKHSCVINNIIDEELFPYHKKNRDDRKKILVVRKFDNICQHSIDQVVLAILELSRKDFFKDLTFDIYGDGNYYDQLVEPIKKLNNINLYRMFIPNEKLNDIYKDHGMMLLPSRHDAHAVSMGESASTGLVVIGSRVTSNPYFMDEKENHTLADPEDHIELASIIERLYKNPEEFLRVSKNMSEFTRNFNKKNTVMKEINIIKSSIKENNNKMSIIQQSKKNDPILTIVVPAYNVEKYIEKCLVSILNCNNSSKIEVLVINDGSTDNTQKIVESYVKKSNGIIRLINKKNGGYGSVINIAIKEATGKYFKIIDGDDWVDGENLAKLIDIMEKNNSDVILTKGSYEYKDEYKFEDIIKYDNLVENKKYYFDDLTYDFYGFDKYGPIIPTSSYKTKLLKDNRFNISENISYADMEFNAFSIRNVSTITYYSLDIYRYYIGRDGQSISKDTWKKRYKEHEQIIFNILDNLYKNDFSERKQIYVLQKIIANMVDSHLYMLDAIHNQKEISFFLKKIKDNYPNAYSVSIDYINKLNGNCALILKKYKKYVNKNKSIIIPGKCENINDYNRNTINIKKIVKAALPYGIVRLLGKR